jgi:hypothetical protein
MPFVWCAHPLLRIEAGMHLLLPPGAHVRVAHSLPPDLLPAGATVTWPHIQMHGQAHDLSAVPPLSNGWAAKLYAGMLSEGWVGLEQPSSGRRVRFDFNLAESSGAGLWLNYGGWMGRATRPLYNIGPSRASARPTIWVKRCAAVNTACCPAAARARGNWP